VALSCYEMWAVKRLVAELFEDCRMVVGLLALALLVDHLNFEVVGC